MHYAIQILISKNVRLNIYILEMVGAVASSG